MTFRSAFLGFINGEIGQSLEARSDIQLYSTGLRTCTNWLPQATGPLWFRPGFKKLVQSDAAVKLVNYEFSESQTYVFIIGNGLLSVLRCSDNTITASGIVIPITDAQLPNIRWTSSGDSTFIFHPDFRYVRILRNGSDASWVVSQPGIDGFPVSRFPDHGVITMTPSAVSGAITITASAPIFTAAWATESIVMTINSGSVNVTGFTNSTTVSATTRAPLGVTTADAGWKEQSWSDRRGWPITGVFHQNRLVFGGSKSLPQTIWGSKVGSYFNFDQSTVDDDYAWQFTLASGTVETIKDLFSVTKALHMFTSSGEWVELSNPITPSSVQFKRQSPHGSQNTGIKVFGIDNAVLFVDKADRLRALTYDYASDAYTAKNLSVIASSRNLSSRAPWMLSGPTHAGYIRNFAESNLAMFVNDAGNIATVTVDFDQKIQGWARIEAPDDVTFTGLVKVEAGRDLCYVMMEWNGHTWIAQWTTDCHLDLWQTSTDVAKATWTGFTDFASKTVTVVGDGVVYSDVAVDGSGQFTLSDSVATVYVGLGYTATAETLPLAPSINGQLLRGNRLRKVHLDLILRNTAAIYVDGRRVQLRRINDDLLDEPIAEQDITKRVWLSGIGPEPTVLIEARDPLPCTLLGLIVDFKTGLAQ